MKIVVIAPKIKIFVLAAVLKAICSQVKNVLVVMGCPLIVRRQSAALNVPLVARNQNVLNALISMENSVINVSLVNIQQSEEAIV